VCDPEPQLVSLPQKGGLFAKPMQAKYPVDVFFPAFHGTYGEDGCIQGALEFMGAAYTGCGVRAAAIGMNKHVCKQLLSSQGIPVLPDLFLDRSEWDPLQSDTLTDKIMEILPLPLIVKPCNLGSSVAVSSAMDKEQLMISLAGAFPFDRQVMVEPLLEDFFELNVSVLYGNPSRVSAVERPMREDKVLTFEQKYLKGNKKIASSGQGMASLQRDIDPADVPAAMKDEVKAFALKAYGILDCRGAVRFDFLVDRRDNQVYFNEINTLPGSLAYYLWEKAEPALSFTELLTLEVEQALADHAAGKKSQRQIQRKIFKE
ncbi:MAG: D-alanine--D-alanine ligase, partial [bacterium]|jgi:D-alanine-D-alanine ligase|nr:D-alanine--D-alanine ligase [bacterium]